MLVALITMSITFHDVLSHQLGSKGFRFGRASTWGLASPNLDADLGGAAAVAADKAGVPLELTAPLSAAGVPTDRKPTSALEEWAKEQGQTIPKAKAAHSTDGNRATTKEEQVLLLLQALKDPNFHVPAASSSWTHLFVPATASEMAASLKSTRPTEDGASDADLFLHDPEQWRVRHEANNLLTVFSKTYCPYSKKAKALLENLKATFDVVEVDERNDGPALQSVIRQITGHSTVPAVFLKGTLLGGSDDLQRLQDQGVLEGILRGINAIAQ